MMPVARMLAYFFVLMTFGLPSLAADAPGEKVEATTVAGDRVVLHPNGRWEFVDVNKAKTAQEIAKQYPENQVCPPGWRGGILGFGRCIPPGDKDFNRGSMIGK
jgi:hypothetical protein